MSKGNEMSKLTYGQKAVGINFNLSEQPAVDVCKQRYADAIDEMNNLRHNQSTSQEQKRLCSVAITELQTAQMWAVKSLTWTDE